MRACILLGLIALVGSSWCFAGMAAPAGIEIVKNRYSEYCIYHSNGAPASVRLAATELQTYFEKSTGSRLPIVTDSSVPDCPLVSLGTNAASKMASLDVASIPLEGYRILVRGRNIYILGPDTGDEAKTPQGGTSKGTLNGVYTFLEDFIGVRWLMPGRAGEYVPQLDVLMIEVVDRIDEPGFLNRRIAYIQNDEPEVKEWLRRQKQGYSLQLRHGHSFRQIIQPELFDKHPDWFAMHKGNRVPPVGRYKLETTNPGLIKAFSGNVTKLLHKNPTLFSESISPSDGRNWSTSPESLALYDKDPHGRTSVTPLVLDFYNAVAKEVSVAHSNRWVCGYIYADYLFPPSEGIHSLEKNLCLVIAPDLSYTYGLYQNQDRKDWQYIMEAWSKASRNIAYYDLPTSFQGDIGSPNPPGVEILGYIYPRLKKYSVLGVYMYGVSAWGHGAITNYLLAKLNWDPLADVDEVAKDFFEHAYGDEAGPVMQEIYGLLDTTTKRYYTHHTSARHWLNPDIIEGIYVSTLPKVEQLFNKAWASRMNSAERARLLAFKDNMVLFYRYLYKAGFIKVNQYSPFYAPDELIRKIGNAALHSVMLAPKKGLTHRKRMLPQNIKVQELNPLIKRRLPIKPFSLRGDNRALIYSPAGGTVTIRIVVTASFGYLLEYSIRDKSGHIVASGDVNKKSTIEFKAAAKQEYYMDLYAKSGIYRITVKNAVFALSGEMQNRGLHLNNQLIPLYFYIPNSVSTATVTISADGPREVAAAYVLSPTGDKIGVLDTEGGSADRLTIGKNSNLPDFYQIRWKTPIAGNVDDVWVKLDKNIPSWFFVNPDEIVIHRKTNN